MSILAVLLLIPLAQAQHEQGNSDYFEQDLYIQEGWNLIPYGDGLDIEGLQEQHLRAAYVYHPESKEYLDILEYEDSLDQMVDSYGYTAVWVYSDVSYVASVEVDMEIVDNTLKDVKFTFHEGWNFYVLMPQMSKSYSGPHFNMHQDRYESALDGMYLWDDDREWENIHYDFLEWETEDHADDIVLAVLINYDKSFMASVSEDLIVPAFPH